MAQSILRRFVLAIVAFGALSAAPPAMAFSLWAELVDLGGSPAAGTLRVQADQDAREVQRGNDGRYSLQLATEPKTSLTMRAQAQDPVTARTVALWLPEWSLRDNSGLRIYLAALPKVTYQNVDERGACLTDGDRDACLAVLEYAARDVVKAPPSQLRVIVDFNYAKALRNACEFLKYDTCTAAIARLDALIALYPGHQNLFTKATAELGVIQDMRSVVQRIVITNYYDAMKALDKAGHFARAVAVAEEAITIATRDRINLAGTGITIESLRRDAAVYRARAPGR